MLDDIGPDLDEARAKIEATRDALQAALDGQEAPDERWRLWWLGWTAWRPRWSGWKTPLRLTSPWARPSLPRSHTARSAVHEVGLPGTPSSVHYWPSVW